jgi:drug/metabolite transporter (DMT)-like permease
MGVSRESELHRRQLIAHVTLLFMATIWAVNFSVAKIALRHLSPLAFNALRFPLASAALWLLLKRSGSVLLPARSDYARVIGLGLLGNLIYQQFFIFGLNQTRAGIASLLLAGTPLITALLSSALGHERLRPRVWIGVGCTLAGIAMVVGFGARAAATAQSRGTLLGVLLMLGASVSWAFYTVGSRSLIERYGPVPVTAWTLWIGTVGVTLAGLPALQATALTTLGAGTWLAVVYAGVLSIGAAYLIWYNGVRELGNTRTATYSNLVPAIALLVAWLWLGESPSLGELAGAAIIIGGVTLAQSPSAYRVSERAAQ